ncbi:hypothetical protein Scani_34060 [Streptomyces caniferus]|uniref:Uncharacterized protein n=1 Tax=Streptomyces caniferus TaxID=285557 RepID=A0A640S7U8_9ACTN|nr:hypothetical protein Scani_34060 [Streptomyces caniferus]
MHPRSRPAGLTSGFEISMRHTPEPQTPGLVDTTVNIGAGAFVAVASLGLVLIYGPAVVPAIVVLTPLAYVANRSYLARRSRRQS